MKKIHLFHLGLGKVGTELAQQIIHRQPILKREFDLELIYTDVKNSKQARAINIISCLSKLPKPFVLIDTTASDQTHGYILEALKLGGYAVLSNKKPLAQSQEKYDELINVSQGRLWYETTVGAGLPIIRTLKSLLATGDEIIEIKGCFSGTLGFIFSKLEAGTSFSQAVKEAKANGYTEPDPRDDLSGIDVARKALILSRLMGNKLELSDIKLQSLFPQTMSHLSVEKFMEKIPTLDTIYQQKSQRYIATITPQKCTVGIETVLKNSDLGSLKGPENFVQITTKRYKKNPLIIKGPGAGVEITAAGVFSDLLTIAGVN